MYKQLIVFVISVRQKKNILAFFFFASCYFWLDN